MLRLLVAALVCVAFLKAVDPEETTSGSRCPFPRLSGWF